MGTNACPRRRPQRRRAVTLLLALSLGLAASAARAADDLPRISVESGRIEVRRSHIAAPEISMSARGPGPGLSAPAQPGRRTVIESTILGQDYEWGGLKPRLRLGYGAGDGASPTTGYSDVFIRGVLIREFD